MFSQRSSRLRNRGIKDYQIKLLDKVGFAWSGQPPRPPIVPPPDPKEKVTRESAIVRRKSEPAPRRISYKAAKAMDDWDEMFDKLYTYIEKFGEWPTLRESDIQLRKWCELQRRVKKFKELPKIQVRRMNELDFPWKGPFSNQKPVIPEVRGRWKRKPNAQDDPKAAKNDDDDENENDSDSDDDSHSTDGSGTYNEDARSSKENSDSDEDSEDDDYEEAGPRKRRRRTPGPRFTWDETYSNLIKFIRKHGEWPTKKTNYRLAAWMLSQRHAKRSKGLPKDKLDKLNKLSMPWHVQIPSTTPRIPNDVGVIDDAVNSDSNEGSTGKKRSNKTTVVQGNNTEPKKRRRLSEEGNDSDSQHEMTKASQTTAPRTHEKKMKQNKTRRGPADSETEEGTKDTNENDADDEGDNNQSIQEDGKEDVEGNRDVEAKPKRQGANTEDASVMETSEEIVFGYDTTEDNDLVSKAVLDPRTAEDWWKFDPTAHPPSGCTRLVQYSQRICGWDLDTALQIIWEGYREYVEMRAAIGDWDDDRTLPSVPVSRVWKIHILDNEHYQSDCLALFGRVLHHNIDPITDLTHRKTETVKALKKHTGRKRLDPFIWDYEGVDKEVGWLAVGGYGDEDDTNSVRAKDIVG